MADNAHRGGARSALRHFLESEAAGGILLIVAAGPALALANSGRYGSYHHLLHADAAPVLSARLGPMTPPWHSPVNRR